MIVRPVIGSATLLTIVITLVKIFITRVRLASVSTQITRPVLCVVIYKSLVRRRVLIRVVSLKVTRRRSCEYSKQYEFSFSAEPRVKHQCTRVQKSKIYFSHKEHNLKN